MTMFGYACDRCREKHQSCNHELPCKRCTKANSADTCHYTPKRTRSKARSLACSTGMMGSTLGSSNSNSPIGDQLAAARFHAFTQGHLMQPMHFDPNIGGMIPYSSRSPPPHVAMQHQQQTSQHFTHPQAPQSLFSSSAPFAYADASANGGSRFLPSPSMPPHGHHFYHGHAHMQQPHYPMASSLYHPYHALPPPQMMSSVPYALVPPGRRINNQARSGIPKQQGGRRPSRSALGEALNLSIENSSESHASHYSQRTQSPPPPLPYPELLDSIHYAASQHYYSGHSSVPEEVSVYRSMDGSALMASGVLVQEYIRDALAMIHDEGVSDSATQHHVLRAENENVEEMKHPHYPTALSQIERNGSLNAAQSE